MDYGDVPLFGMMKRRLGWLGQRQEVLAKNVANADTPGYAPQDLKPLNFKQEVRRRVSNVAMQQTSEQHLQGQVRGNAMYREGTERKPYETAPGGNAVIIEEQASKIAETKVSHDLATRLYRTYNTMFKVALGRGGQ